MEVMCNNYIPGDSRLIEQLVSELKSEGIFDQFRKECISDVDTKPAYQNLRQRVEGNVVAFLNQQTWSIDLNKNQLREQLRKNIHESGFLETGVERIVDQVVNPKINTVFLPKVEEVVYRFLGIQKPARFVKKEAPVTITDLLPTDLEAISPESVHSFKTESKKADSDIQNVSLPSSGKLDEEESPPFEPLGESRENGSIHNEKMLLDENTRDSHLSGFSGLESHDSNNGSELKSFQMELSNQDSHVSLNSSESHLSIVTSEDTMKMEICEDSNNDIKLEKSTISIGLEATIGDESIPKENKSNENKNIQDETDNIYEKTVDKKSKSSEKYSKDKKDDKYRKSSSNSSSKDKSSSKHSSQSKRESRDKDKRDSKSSSSRDKDKSKEKTDKEKYDKEKSDKDKSKYKEKSDQEKVKNDKDKLDKDKGKSDKNKSDKDSSNTLDKDKVEKEKSDRSKDRSDKSKSDKDKSRSDKDKINKDRSDKDKTEKDKNSKEKDKLKEKSSKSKDKSDKEKIDKDKSSKEKLSKEKSTSSKESKDKAKEENKDARDKSKEDKDRSRSSSSSTKHSSSKDKKPSTPKKESSSHLYKDKSSSSSSSTSDFKSKHSSEKSKKEESNEKYSSDKKDKQKDSRKKSKDDHYSSKIKKTDRRSTDRDSNDGQSSKKYLNTYSDSASSRSENNSQDCSSSSFTGGSGDSGNSDQVETTNTDSNSTVNEEKSTIRTEVQKVKYIKPKFALNFAEARKIMKIRKQLAMLERKNQLSLVNIELPIENGITFKDSSNSTNIGNNIENEIDTNNENTSQCPNKSTNATVNKTENNTIDSNQINLKVNRYEKEIIKSSCTSKLNEVHESEEQITSIESTDLSKENWEALEAKLAQVMAEINYNSYDSDDDFEFHGYSSIDIIPKNFMEMSLDLVKKTEMEILNHQQKCISSNTTTVNNRLISTDEKMMLSEDLSDNCKKITHANLPLKTCEEFYSNKYISPTEESPASNFDKNNGVSDKFLSVNHKIVHNYKFSQENYYHERDSLDLCYFLEKPSQFEEQQLMCIKQMIHKLERDISVPTTKSQNNYFLSKRGRKRKLEDNDFQNNNKNIYTETVKKRRGSTSSKTLPPMANKRLSNNTDITPAESFSLPLSPAESDKSSDRKDEDLLIPMKQKRIIRGYSQRYSSDDLYKPRPIIGKRNKFQKRRSGLM